MSKRVTGAIFCSIAAFLFAIRYVVAAILQVARFSNQDIWGGGGALGVFFSAYEDTVNIKEVGALLICSIIALVIGIVYLVYGEYAEWVNHRRELSEDTPSTKSN